MRIESGKSSEACAKITVKKETVQGLSKKKTIGRQNQQKIYLKSMKYEAQTWKERNMGRNTVRRDEECSIE